MVNSLCPGSPFHLPIQVFLISEQFSSSLYSVALYTGQILLYSVFAQMLLSPGKPQVFPLASSKHQEHQQAELHSLTALVMEWLSCGLLVAISSGDICLLSSLFYSPCAQVFSLPSRCSLSSNILLKTWPSPFHLNKFSQHV